MVERLEKIDQRISNYNYNHFKAEYYLAPDCKDGKEIMPDLRLYDLDGKEVRLSFEPGRRTVLETGSLTCPMYIDHISRMNALAETFNCTRFVVIYVREAHPGGALQKHASLNQKLAYARRLRSDFNERRTVLVDALSGDNHAQFGFMPNACMLIGDNQEVLYRSDWTSVENLELLLSGLILSDTDAPYHGHLDPAFPPATTMMSTLSQAGFSAIFDFTRSLPAILRNRQKLRRHLHQARAKKNGLKKMLTP